MVTMLSEVDNLCRASPSKEASDLYFKETPGPHHWKQLLGLVVVLADKGFRERANHPMIHTGHCTADSILTQEPLLFGIGENSMIECHVTN